MPASPEAPLSLPAAAPARPVWLRVGTLIDGVGATPLRSAHVVYNSREILHVGTDAPAAGLLVPGQHSPDADLPGHTLLPGLIEAHAHFFLEGGELDPQKRAAYLRQSPATLLALARARLEKLVRLGITAVRDAGDKDGVGLALSRLSKSGRGPGGGYPMPIVDSPGAAIHHRGRYGSFMADPVEDFPSPLACVEARVRSGADRIKLIATGIIDFERAAVTSAPQMSGDEVAAFVAAARSFDRQTLAHASGASGIENVLSGGVDSVEHGFFVTADQLAQMRDRQIAWTPTFAPVQKQLDHADRMGWDAPTQANLRRILDQHAASLRRAHALGVPLLAGSDAGSWGVPHGLGLLEEMELMQRAGLPPLAVISAVTAAPSRHLAFRENLGRIRPGFLSRFLLTRYSPLDTVANLRQPEIVVFDGVGFPPHESIDPHGL